MLNVANGSKVWKQHIIFTKQMPFGDFDEKCFREVVGDEKIESVSVMSILWNFSLKKEDKDQVEMKKNMGQKDYHF